MNTKEYVFSWHLSLRADRPVEGCPMRPHAYMYGKKLDERDLEKAMQPHTKIMKEPPPNHEFSYRWFRGPVFDPCAPDERRIRLTIGPNTPWEEPIVPCNVCPHKAVCTNPPFVIRPALSVRGKRSIRYPRNKSICAVSHPRDPERDPLAVTMICLTKRLVCDLVDHGVRHPTIVRIRTTTATAPARRHHLMEEEEDRLHHVDIWGDTTATTAISTTSTIRRNTMPVTIG